MTGDRRPQHRPLITSTANPHLKLMRSLVRRNTRRAERAFLLEGRRLVEDAVASGATLRRALLREDVDPGWLLLAGVDPARIHRVSSAAFDASSDVEHSQGIAAIAELPEPFDPGACEEDRILVLDAIRDPGNMGTLLRSAAASGVATVVVTHGSVDPFAPKVVRAAMGAHVRLNLGFWSGEWEAWVERRGVPLVHADSAAETPYDRHDWCRPWALVIGGETEPLSNAVAGLMRDAVSIPMQRDVESLNAAVAGSVLLFEAARQQLRAGSTGADCRQVRGS